MRYAIGFLAILLILAAAYKGLGVLEQRHVAAKAVAELRDAYNAGCGSVFKEGDEGLRPEERLAGQSWVTECMQLQSALGRWLLFDVETNQVPETTVPELRYIRATGSAMFRNGLYHIEVVWGLSTGNCFKDRKPQLLSLTVVSGHGDIRRFPRPYEALRELRERHYPSLMDQPPRPMLMDPPPRPTGSSGAAG